MRDINQFFVVLVLIGLGVIAGLVVERELHVCPEPQVKLMSVMDSQRLLVERGYDIKVDGKDGPATQKAFNEAYGNQCAAKYFKD